MQFRPSIYWLWRIRHSRNGKTQILWCRLPPVGHLPAKVLVKLVQTQQVVVVAVAVAVEVVAVAVVIVVVFVVNLFLLH